MLQVLFLKAIHQKERRNSSQNIVKLHLPDQRHLEQIRQKLHQQTVRGHAAIDSQRGQRHAVLGVQLHRIGNFDGLKGTGLQRCADNVCLGVMFGKRQIMRKICEVNKYAGKQVNKWQR